MPSLLRALASPVPLILDTALLHNLFSTPKFIVDELVFLAPPRIDRFTFADSITHTLVIGCCGLVALTFLTVLLRREDGEAEAPSEGELQEGGSDLSGTDVDATDALKGVQFVAGISYGQTQPCTEIGAGEPVFGDMDCDGDADAVDLSRLGRFSPAGS